MPNVLTFLLTEPAQYMLARRKTMQNIFRKTVSQISIHSNKKHIYIRHNKQDIMDIGFPNKKIQQETLITIHTQEIINKKKRKTLNNDLRISTLQHLPCSKFIHIYDRILFAPIRYLRINLYYAIIKKRLRGN